MLARLLIGMRGLECFLIAGGSKDSRSTSKEYSVQ
jgi:hypothetical protein